MHDVKREPFILPHTRYESLLFGIYRYIPVHTKTTIFIQVVRIPDVSPTVEGLPGLRVRLAGGLIPVLKRQQYMSNMHGVTFYLSTVGDVIIAAQRNADALAAARLPGGRLASDFAYPRAGASAGPD